MSALGVARRRAELYSAVRYAGRILRRQRPRMMILKTSSTRYYSPSTRLCSLPQRPPISGLRTVRLTVVFAKAQRSSRHRRHERYEAFPRNAKDILRRKFRDNSRNDIRSRVVMMVASVNRLAKLVLPCLRLSHFSRHLRRS